MKPTFQDEIGELTIRHNSGNNTCRHLSLEEMQYYQTQIISHPRNQNLMEDLEDHFEGRFKGVKETLGQLRIYAAREQRAETDPKFNEMFLCAISPVVGPDTPYYHKDVIPAPYGSCVR